MDRECINLKRRFGDRYRVRYEESYYAEYGEDARTEDPWLMIIPCRRGHVFPWRGTTLAASIDGHPRIAKQLKQLPWCQVAQDGDDGTTLLFDVERFDEIAQIIMPYRRPQLTPEQRAERAERMRKVRAESLRKSRLSRQECVCVGAPV